MHNRQYKLGRNALAVVASLWIATPSSLALADGFVSADNTIRTLSGNFTNMMVIFQNTDKRIYTAKVIVENLSSGVRSVQCELQVGEGTWRDFANATMAAGESQTLSLMIHKDSTLSAHGSLRCKVFSAATTGCVAAWSKLHIEPA
jgi:hypothetical protein